MRGPAAVEGSAHAWWSRPTAALLDELASSDNGLSTAAATAALERWGPNALHVPPVVDPLRLVLHQLANPLVLVLVVAAAISAVVHELVDAAVIVAIVVGSTALTVSREHRAATAVEKLRSRLVLRVQALRDGQAREVTAAEVVPGDVVLLAAGALVPADGVLLEATDLFVNQAALTGETYPAEKTVETASSAAPLAERRGAVFQGTSVRSGMGRLLVVDTGRATVYGRIAGELLRRPPESELERGLRGFGYLVARIMMALVLVVFAVNVFDRKPPVDSLLFAMALAVGLSPELLPAILAVNLAHGAQDMARRGVIVRRLNAIESFGSMDVLCLDKTGTLTTGVVALTAALDPEGEPSMAVLNAACLNASLEAGLPNPLDEALRAAGEERGLALGGATKLGEVPYDFVRKRLSVGVEDGGRRQLLTKGAFDGVLTCCTAVAGRVGQRPLDEALREALRQRYAAWSDDGLRVLGVAGRELEPGEPVGRSAERAMTFLGFLLFSDPAKPGVAERVAELAALGVELKILTGDNRRVAAHVAHEVGLATSPLLTGEEIDRLRPEALWQRASEAQLFAELDPQHKERLLRALQRGGRIVGFLGDGINDAPALHAADVGISVDDAVDVAKEAADLVLLRPDLGVLREGIAGGRRTFANTMKYLLVTSSANFGNMVSMAVASAGLSFLPLLAKQILLNNFLSDVPALALSGDGVDPELMRRPRHWDLRQVRDSMVVFGLVSSVFDLLLFAFLLWWVHATPEAFRTGWFVASLLTEVAVMLVLRTRRPFYRSRPSAALVGTSAAVAVVAIALPYLPWVSSMLGFTPLPAELMAVMVLVTLLYVAASEAVKRAFYRRHAG
jgi:Mg2+-importing ATPase